MNSLYSRNLCFITQQIHMHILILHQIGKRAAQIQKRLRYENIQSEIISINNFEWEKCLDKLTRAHALALCVKSPNFLEPLELIPDLVKKNRQKIPIVCFDETFDRDTELLARRNFIKWYFAAPFSFSQIALRLKFLMYRKNQSNGDNTMRLSDLTINFLSHQVKRKNEIIPLKGREFALVEYFALNKGKILTRNMILEQIWDRNVSILSNTIDVHIGRLRKKLETNGKKYFHTIHSIGYKFDPVAILPAQILPAQPVAAQSMATQAMGQKESDTMIP